MKKLTITLVMALLLSSMSISAWAAPVTSDLSSATNVVSSKTCSNASQAGACTGTSNLLDCLKSFGAACSATDNEKNCSQTNSANTTTCNTSVESFLKSCGLYIKNAETGNSDDANVASASDDSSAASTCKTAVQSAGGKTAAAAAATKAADVKQAAKTINAAAQNTCPPDATAQPSETTTDNSTDAATCNGNGCTAGENCALLNCDANGENCDTSDCATKSDCNVQNAAVLEKSDSALFNFLSGLLQKCGIKADFLSFLINSFEDDSDGQGAPSSPIPSDSGTETPAPTPNDSDNETPAPTPTPNDSDNETPAPTPTPSDSGNETTAPSGNIDNLSFEQQVVTLVNEQRAANGLSPLTLNAKLSDVARAKSQDMHDNNYFAHQSPTYGSPFDMMKSFGISYRAAGENIAMGYATPQAVVNAWMNSEGHRANILNSSFTQIGVGYVADGNYWTQEFIG